MVLAYPPMSYPMRLRDCFRTWLAPLWLAGVLLALAGCSESGDPLFEAERVVPEEPVEVKVPVEEQEPPPPPFVIYYALDPIPGEMIQAWRDDVAATWEVEQRALPTDMSGFPDDGDFYVVSPQWVPWMREGVDLVEWEPYPLLEAVDPMFTHFSFDPDNESVLPWRWAPLGWVVPVGAEPSGATEWRDGEGGAWPADPLLKAAVQRHQRGEPANRFQVAPQPVQDVSLTTWSALRKKWNGGNGDLAAGLIPLAWWLHGPQGRGGSDEAGRRLRWDLPQRVALIQFDHLCVPQDRDRTVEARSLVGFLLREDQQEKVFSLSGYFPVRAPVAPALEASGVPGLSMDWLNRSEFPLAPPDFEIPREEEPEPPDPLESPDPTITVREEDGATADEAEDAPEAADAPVAVPLDQIPLDPPVGL